MEKSHQGGLSMNHKDIKFKLQGKKIVMEVNELEKLFWLVGFYQGLLSKFLSQDELEKLEKKARFHG
jgi:hypothetical protein